MNEGRQPGDDDASPTDDIPGDDGDEPLQPLGDVLDQITLGLIQPAHYGRASSSGRDENQTAEEPDREEQARIVALLAANANVIRRIRDRDRAELRELERAGLATDVDRQRLAVVEDSLRTTHAALHRLGRRARHG